LVGTEITAQVFTTPLNGSGVDVSAVKLNTWVSGDQPSQRSTTAASEIENSFHLAHGGPDIVERSLDGRGNSLTNIDKKSYVSAFGHLVPKKGRRNHIT
jgi:hypothetical protein